MNDLLTQLDQTEEQLHEMDELLSVYKDTMEVRALAPEGQRTQDGKRTLFLRVWALRRPV